MAAAAASALAPWAACAQDDAGHAMSGMAMGGMRAQGITPPPARRPPPGPVLTLYAGRPMAGPAVRGSPGQIVLVLPRPASMAALTLTNAAGQQVPTHLTLPGGPVGELRIPVVIPLRPGGYTLAWTVSAGDAPSPAHAAFEVRPWDGSDSAPPRMHHPQGQS